MDDSTTIPSQGCVRKTCDAATEIARFADLRWVLAYESTNIYIYICICICIGMYVYLYIYIYVCMYVWMYIYIYIWTLITIHFTKPQWKLSLPKFSRENMTAVWGSQIVHFVHSYSAWTSAWTRFDAILNGRLIGGLTPTILWRKWQGGYISDISFQTAPKDF